MRVDLARAAQRSPKRAKRVTMNQPPQKPAQPALQIKTDDDTAKGRFANLAQVGSTPDSVVFDFAFAHGPVGWLLARILMSPAHAKRLHAVLGDTIRNHEKVYGPIDTGPTIQ